MPPGNSRDRNSVRSEFATATPTPCGGTNLSMRTQATTAPDTKAAPIPMKSVVIAIFVVFDKATCAYGLRGIRQSTFGLPVNCAAARTGVVALLIGLQLLSHHPHVRGGLPSKTVTKPDV
jgi:hypothetical protein